MLENTVLSNAFKTNVELSCLFPGLMEKKRNACELKLFNVFAKYSVQLSVPQQDLYLALEKV